MGQSERFRLLGGLGFKVFGLGFEVLRLGFEVLGLGYGVLELGYEVLGLKPRSPIAYIAKTRKNTRKSPK